MEGQAVGRDGKRRAFVRTSCLFWRLVFSPACTHPVHTHLSIIDDRPKMFLAFVTGLDSDQPEVRMNLHQMSLRLA